ncbi:MAG: UDP-3-O-(3-hydroxymyristoyl)glucosamine N-acyltransferase [Pseudomonadota bacterium]
MPRDTTHTIAEIAAALGLEAWGETGLAVSRAAAPHQAGPDAIALAATPAYADALAQGDARAALLWSEADPAAYGLAAAIFAPRPRFSLAGLSRMMDAGPDIAPGIHPTAVIDASAEIGAQPAIGPFVVIGAGARIGANARIGAHSILGRGAVLGDDALLYPRATLGERVCAGDRLIVQPGAVIGGDGFSFVTPEASAVETVRATLGDAQGRTQQAYARIHSLGSVRLGDDVEIGANTTIDRATLADTVIGDGTKIDNLVQIAHNVETGRDCLICGHAGIAGSTRIGDRCVFAGKAAAVDNITIGDDVIVSGATVVRTSQPSGRVLLGDPAMPMQTGIEVFKALRRLPRLARDVAALRKHLPKDGASD